MKNAKDLVPIPQELLHELQTLLTEAKTMMAGSVSEHSTEAFSNLRQRFDAAHERCANAYAEAGKNVIAGARRTDETIRENPYQSLAIAAGIALLVGVVVGRSTK